MGPLAAATRCEHGRGFCCASRQPRGVDWKWPGPCSAVTDFSDKVEFEEKLKQVEKERFHQAKLASIGELAAGVGHEINNPLAVVSMCMEKIQLLFEQEEIDRLKVIETMKKHELAVNRIVNIVKGLRSFARADDEKFEKI